MKAGREEAATEGARRPKKGSREPQRARTKGREGEDKVSREGHGGRKETKKESSQKEVKKGPSFRRFGGPKRTQKGSSFEAK